MGLYRDENGNVIETEDRYAQSLGYEPVNEASYDSAVIDEQAAQMRGEERGALGTLNAALTGAASALTLGGSDYLLGAALEDNERERLNAELEANPEARVAGEIGGAVVGAFANPASVLGKTPAGFLSNATASAVESAAAVGGVKGTAKALGYMGVEGALQNAGQYIGRAAIADKPTTVEGMAGALGTGFTFGAAGGGAALGISKGTIAARKMFSKYIDGGEDAIRVAENAWSKQSQEILDADAENVLTAKKNLEDIRLAKSSAQLERQRKAAWVKEEQVRAASAEKPQPPITPPNAKPIGEMHGPFENYGPAEPVRPRYGPDEIYGAAAPEMNGPVHTADAGLPSVTSQDVTRQIPKEQLQRVRGGTSTPAAEMTDLERQLAGTADGLSKGKKLSGMTPTGAERVEVVRSGKPSARTFEVRTWKPGATAPEVRIVKADELPSIADGNLPDGFTAGALNPRTPFNLERGVPSSAADVKPNTLYTVKPSELAERGIFGNELSGEHLSSVKQAFNTGKKLPPLDINITPEGRLFLEDGNHRLMASLADDRPMAINFRKVGADFKPQAGVVDITPHLRPPVAGPRVATAQERLVGDLANDLDVLGDDLMKQEQELTAALEEFEKARSSFFDALGDPAANNFGKVARRGMPDPEGGVPLDFAKRDKTSQEAGTKAGAGGKRKAVEIDEAYDEMLVKGDEAGADALERELASLDHEKLLDDVAHKTTILANYEKASARLAEALGDSAHPTTAAMAKAVREADDDATRAMMERMGQHAEDAEMFGPYENYGPDRLSPQKRVQYARARKGEADLAYADLVTKETEAAQALEGAQATDEARKQALKTISLPEPVLGKKGAGRLSKAADAGAAAEIFDIPGMPKPSDIPVVGPLLGAWLKMRGAKAVMSRFSGRVPASANAKVAALSAKTRDRVAKAIDSALTGTASKAAVAQRAAPSLAGILSSRIYDDGEPDAPKDADIPTLVATRAREITAYANNPSAITRDVRRELRDVTDPDLINEAVKHRIALIQHLAQNAPLLPPPNPFYKTPVRLSPAEAMSWARRYEAAHDPAGVFEKIQNTRDMITLEAAETLRAVYPQMFLMGQQFLLARATKLQADMPYEQRLRMSQLMGAPLDSTLEPDSIALYQSVFAKPQPAPMPGAPQPPMPSIAGETNMTALFQTTADRRASR